MFLRLDVTRDVGATRAGMWLGAWLLWAGWLVVGTRSARPRFGRLAGGCIAMLARCLFVPHVAVGMVAVSAGDAAFGHRGGRSGPGAFGWGLPVTVLTGHLVLLPCLGLLLSAGRASGTPPEAERTDEGDE